MPGVGGRRRYLHEGLRRARSGAATNAPLRGATRRHPYRFARPAQVDRAAVERASNRAHRGQPSFASLPEHRKGPGRFRRSASPGKWREGLTPEEQLLALEIMGSRLAKLGYEGDSEPA